MSLLAKNLIGKLWCHQQEAYQSLQIYYQKIAHATRYRFHKRLLAKSISYPPNINGDTDYTVTTKDEENEFIRKILKIREHPEEALFPNEYALEGPPKGRVYEKQPFKFQVEAGKAYSFCTCGHSNSQPFCDGTHKMLWTTHLKKKFPKYRPIRYIAKRTEEVYFCNCKQSNNRPLCDGTHKLDIVTNANSVK